MPLTPEQIEEQRARAERIANASRNGTDTALIPAAPFGLVTIAMAAVVREEVTWLWRDRLVVGRLNGFIGDPGAGKSWLSLAVTTAVTLGQALPGDTDARPPANVLLLTAEDGLADTVRPRLEDMGADLHRVTALTGVRDLQGHEHPPSLVDDLGLIEQHLTAREYALVVIDPINSYLGSSLDTHRDAALRSTLMPLAALAERCGVAVLFVGHLNKSSRDRAIYRANGSIGYVGASRVVHLIGLNPEDEHERAVVCIKNNLALIPAALAFEIDDGRFLWRGESSITAAALLAPEQGAADHSAQADAEQLLNDLLGDGPVAAEAVYKEARSSGISKRTLDRAKRNLGIKSEREGYGKEGRWAWKLPYIAKVAKQEDLATYDEFVSEAVDVVAKVGNLWDPCCDDTADEGYLSRFLSNGHANPGGEPPIRHPEVFAIAEALGFPALTIRDPLKPQIVRIGIAPGRENWVKQLTDADDATANAIIAHLAGGTPAEVRG